jgi:biopolymer transport protein ExbD
MRMTALPENTVETGGGPMFAAINVPPLTDVFLVLIGLFVVGALAVPVGRSAPPAPPPAAPERIVVKLLPRPEREAVEEHRKSLPTCSFAKLLPHARDLDLEPPRLVVQLRSSGGVIIGGKLFTGDRLDAVFRAARARDAQTTVILRVERGVAHGSVVQVMERAREHGLSRLAVAIREP